MTTPNYSMFLSTDDDQMNDVDQSLNNNWTIVESIPQVPSVSSLPITDFSYNVGDRIYHTGVQGIFILVASNAAWGNFWQPIQTKYSPWVQPGNSILSDLALYKFTTNPIQYRLTNKSKFIMRGSVDTVAATGYVDFESAAATAGLKDIPLAISPSSRSMYGAAAYPQTSGSAKPIVAQLAVSAAGQFTNGVWNPLNNATSLFYDGWEWTMGFGHGYGSNN